MKAILPIAAAAALLTVAAAAPVLSQSTTTTTTIESDADICAGADTQSAWASGNASSRLAKPDATVAAQQAYCAGLRTTTGTDAAATATTDTRGAVGDNSGTTGTTGTASTDATDTDAAAGMTTTTDKPAQPGQ